MPKVERSQRMTTQWMQELNHHSGVKTIVVVDESKQESV
jgi:hypothetical protein